MSHTGRRNSLRKRLIRDLVVAAALIVLILAYFIPGIVSTAQDLSVTKRSVSYEAETVRFSNDNSFFTERLRMMSGSYWSDNSYIVIESGRVYDAESALKEAKKQLLTLLSDEYTGFDVIRKELDDMAFTDLESYSVYPVLVVGEESGEPFIVWFIEIDYYEQTKFDIVLDDSTGKILCFEISGWYGALGGLDSVAYVDHTEILAGIAKYYGMDAEGYRIYTEEPWVIEFYCEKDGERIELPVGVWYGEFGFNTPSARNYLAANEIPYDYPAETEDWGETGEEYDEQAQFDYEEEYKKD